MERAYGQGESGISLRLYIGPLNLLTMRVWAYSAILILVS